MGICQWVTLTDIKIFQCWHLSHLKSCEGYDERSRLNGLKCTLSNHIFILLCKLSTYFILHFASLLLFQEKNIDFGFWLAIICQYCFMNIKGLTYLKEVKMSETGLSHRKTFILAVMIILLTKLNIHYPILTAHFDPEAIWYLICFRLKCKNYERLHISANKFFWPKKHAQVHF